MHPTTPPAATAASRPAAIDNRPVFDPTVIGFSEAYYVIWTDPEAGRSMVVRYVLFNGPVEDYQIAEVWCWYRDRLRGDDIAIRQRYPLTSARISPSGFDLRIGAGSGITDERAWGVVEDNGRVVSWDFHMPASAATGVDRLRGAAGSVLFPRFYSTGCRRTLDARVRVDGAEIVARGVAATDGHYWNTHNLRTWSWANGVRFRGAPDAFLETIAFRLHSDDAPMAVSLTLGDGGWIWQNDMLESLYLNRELETQLERWKVSAGFGGRRVEAEVTGDPDDMILITHPLPDGSFLYTTITLEARIRVVIHDEGPGGGTRVLESEGGASFEVTKPVRNERVRREFRIVPAPSRLLGPVQD